MPGRRNIILVLLTLIVIILHIGCDLNSESRRIDSESESKLLEANKQAAAQLDKDSELAYTLAENCRIQSLVSHNLKQELEAILTISSALEDKGNITQAENLLEAGIYKLDSLTTIKPERGLELSGIKSRLISNLGNVMLRMGNYDKAIDQYLKAIELTDTINDKKQASDIYNNIGTVYLDIGNYDQSRIYHEKSLLLRRGLNDKKLIAASLQNIDNIYFNQMLDSTALEYYRQSLQIREEIGDSSGTAYSLNAIAGVMVDFGKDDNAIELILRSIEIRKKTKEYRNLPNLYGNIADIYSMSGRYQEAIHYLDDAMKLANEIHSKKDIRNIHESYSFLYQQMHLPEKSLEHYKLFAAFKDSVINELSATQINELQQRFDVVQKENKILQQASDLEQQQSKTRLLLFALAIIVLISILIFYRIKATSIQRENSEKLRLAQEYQSNLIAAQENERRYIAGELHDGLGQILSAAKLNLESVSDRIKEENRQQMSNAIRLLNQSFDELRSISHHMLPAQLNQYGLCAAINDMISTLRIDSKIHFSIDSNPDFPRLQQETELHLFRIVQEWISNILRHSDASEVSIQLTNEGNEVTLMIEDNSSGLEKSQLEKSRGNGWYNIKTRSHLIHATLDIESENGRGLLLLLTFPMHVTKPENSLG